MSNHQQRIHEYLDGTLPAHLHEQLFGELSCNKELREEFSLQLSVQQKASADASTIIAPDDIKENVFTELGLPLHNPLVPTSSEITMPIPVFSGFFGIGSTAVTALLTGAFVMWFFMQKDYVEPTIIRNNNTISSKYSQQKNNLFSESHNIIQNHNDIPYHDNSEKRQQNEYIIPVPLSLINNTIENAQTELYKNETETESTEIISNSLPHNYIQSYSFTPSSSDNKYLDFVQLPYLDENNIQMRIASVTPLGTNTHAAFIAQCMYESDERNYIGIEYSQGSYTRLQQEFIDGEELSKTDIEKFSAFSTTYQHNFSSLQLNDIIPIMQVSLGGTTTGQPLARYSVALRWTPENRVSLTLGADISVLGYRNENRWNTSVNTGIVSGVNIRF